MFESNFNLKFWILEKEIELSWKKMPAIFSKISPVQRSVVAVTCAASAAYYFYSKQMQKAAQMYENFVFFFSKILWNFCFLSNFYEKSFRSKNKYLFSFQIFMKNFSDRNRKVRRRLIKLETEKEKEAKTGRKSISLYCGNYCITFCLLY